MVEKGRKEEKEEKKRTRQKEEEYDEIFKRSKLVERSPSKRMNGSLMNEWNIKWSLDLDFCAPAYIVYKESGIYKIRITGGYKAVKFEEKALKGDDRRLLKECVKIRERKKDSKGWMGEREDFYRQNGFSTEGIKDFKEREM